jgi:hypothetical protein
MTRASEYGAPDKPGKALFFKGPSETGKEKLVFLQPSGNQMPIPIEREERLNGKTYNDLGTSFYGSTPYVGGCAVRAHDSRPVSRQFRFLDDERFFLERFNRTTCLTLDWLYHRQLLLMLMMHLVNQ